MNTHDLIIFALVLMAIVMLSSDNIDGAEMFLYGVLGWVCSGMIWGKSK